MAQTVQLKRSALSGKVPGTGSLNLGELALNTYDGKIFFRRSGSTDTVQEVITTNVTNTGSITITGALTAESIRTNLTASFGSLKVNDTLTVNHGETIISGSALVTSDLTILGAVNARQFNISVISSSVLFESGSSRFGNTSDDIHSFTGSVQISGSQNINGNIYVTGSIIPAGSASFDLGTATNPFRHLYVGNGSIYLGGNQVLSINDGGQLTIDAPPQADSVFINGGNLNVAADILIRGGNGLAFRMDNNITQAGAIQNLQTAEGDIHFEGQYSGTSGFKFRNTHPSCSIGSADYATIKPNGINMWPNGMLDIGSWGGGYMHITNSVEISGSSTTIQGVNFNTFSSSLDSRIVSGSTQIIANLPTGTISGSSQLTSSVLATTGSNTFRGDQIVNADLYISASKLLYFGVSASIRNDANGITVFDTNGGFQNRNFTTGEWYFEQNANAGMFFLNRVAGIAISGSSTTIQDVNFIPFSASLNNRITTLTNLTSSYTTTGSNVFSGSQTITGSVTATSFVGNGSGLTDLVVDLGTAQLNDVDGNNIPARSFAELYLACAVAEIVDLDFGI